MFDNFIEIPFHLWSDFFRVLPNFFPLLDYRPMLICIMAILMLLNAIHVLDAV